jgi:hypothetical protein
LGIERPVGLEGEVSEVASEEQLVLGLARGAGDDKKSIYSLGDLQEILAVANRRCLDFISAIDDPSAGNKVLTKICEPKAEDGRNYSHPRRGPAADADA